MADDFYVYIHFRADDKKPFYVGKGKGSRAQSTRRSNPHWHATAEKHGLIVSFYRTGVSEEVAFTIERDLIRVLSEVYPDTMTNICGGGEGYSRPKETEVRKQKIRDYFSEFGRFPGNDEKDLQIICMNYCSPSQDTYDREFHMWCADRGYGQYWTKSSTKTKEDIVDFYRTTGRLPRMSTERALAQKMYSYTKNSSEIYDPEFHSWAISVGYGKNNRARTTKGVSHAV